MPARPFDKIKEDSGRGDRKCKATHSAARL
jgi:hypothetical protein